MSLLTDHEVDERIVALESKVDKQQSEIKKLISAVTMMALELDKNLTGKNDGL